MDASQAERLRHDEELAEENAVRLFRLNSSRARAPWIDVVKPFKVVRIPLAFDTPDLTPPDGPLSIYEPFDGDTLLCSWMWIPSVSWDGTDPRILVGPEGDVGAMYTHGLEETGINWMSESFPLDGSPILATIDNTDYLSPESTKGEGEFGMLIIREGT